jgi:hypothetical protein
MPLFTYKCKNNHTEDNIVSYSKREEPQVCPDCGEPSYYELTFCTNFQFGQDYRSFAADTHRWNMRENKRLNTNGKNYV